jgi:N-methylhydantoinase A
MATRIGVDVGGTFTDLVTYHDETGEVRVWKETTTPEAPEEGVIEAVRRGVPERLLRSAAFFLHGTTVGLNALLERRGAVVGLLATRGFRDVLETRRGDRDDPYDLFWHPPDPLVPRDLRLPVTERIRADGSVETLLEPEDVGAALDVFRGAGVTSVAVAFLNAYANPAHERETARLLRELGFEGELSLSHEVSGEYREYERTCTTVVDAFVRARTGAYLERLETQLRKLGFAGSAFVTRSGGGALTFTEAASRPVETILSGPVGGAQGAAALALELGFDEAIGADVGGTSFDTCLIVSGRPQVLYEGRIVGLPLQTPWVDVRSIGAGGGSIAHVDVGGLLRVGPRSAGASPGPASYGRGGVEPTVTDAALVLGLLGPGELAGGLALDPGLALRALEPVAAAAGFASAEEAARGVLVVAASGMADAIREITVEQGRDPRDASLVAFDGAGPLFATLLARELGVSRTVVPRHPGNFSAWGLLGADLTRERARTRILPLTDEGLARARALLEELGHELGEADGAVREERLDLRYVGQEHTLTVTAPREARADTLRSRFATEYDRTFGHTMEEEVEIVSLRAAVRIALPQRAERAAPARGAPTATADAWSFTRGEQLPFAVVRRAGLAANDELTGPAIVLEETATTYLDAGFVALVHETGALLVEESA